MGGVRLLDRCVSAICTHYQRPYQTYHQLRCNGASSTFHIIIPPRPGSPRRGVWLETQRGLNGGPDRGNERKGDRKVEVEGEREEFKNQQRAERRDYLKRMN